MTAIHPEGMPEATNLAPLSGCGPNSKHGPVVVPSLPPASFLNRVAVKHKNHRENQQTTKSDSERTRTHDSSVNRGFVCFVVLFEVDARHYRPDRGRATEFLDGGSWRSGICRLTISPGICSLEGGTAMIDLLMHHWEPIVGRPEPGGQIGRAHV